MAIEMRMVGDPGSMQVRSVRHVFCLTRVAIASKSKYDGTRKHNLKGIIFFAVLRISSVE
jgi:hypothetical protein